MVFKDFAPPLAADPGGAQARRHQHGAGHGAETGAARARSCATACPSARRRRSRAPAEVQTAALRCASAECAANRQGVRGNFTLSLAHSDQHLADGEAAATVTEPIAWGASEDDVRAAEKRRGRPRRRQGRPRRPRPSSATCTLTFWGGRHAGATALEVTRSSCTRTGSRLGELVEPTSIHVDTVRNGVAPGRHPPYPAFSPDHESLPRQRAKRSSCPPSEERTVTPGLVPSRPTAVVLGEHYRDEPVAGLAPAPPRRRRDGHGLPLELDDSAPSTRRRRRTSPEVAFVHEVQTVTTTARRGRRRGTFTLSWGGRTTKALKYDVAAEDVADAVSKLTGVWDVGVPSVRRPRRARAGLAGASSSSATATSARRPTTLPRGRRRPHRGRHAAGRRRRRQAAGRPSRSRPSTSRRSRPSRAPSRSTSRAGRSGPTPWARRPPR